jgi:hypothetical protein
MWWARFGRGFGPVVRQTAKWMNACKTQCACAIFHLQPSRLCNILTHCIINGMIFEKTETSLNATCVFWFSLIYFSLNVSNFKWNFARYHKRTHVFMYS